MLGPAALFFTLACAQAAAAKEVCAEEDLDRGSQTVISSRGGDLETAGPPARDQVLRLLPGQDWRAHVHRDRLLRRGKPGSAHLCCEGRGQAPLRAANHGVVWPNCACPAIHPFQAHPAPGSQDSKHLSHRARPHQGGRLWHCRTARALV